MIEVSTSKLDRQTEDENAVMIEIEEHSRHDLFASLVIDRLHRMIMTLGAQRPSRCQNLRRRISMDGSGKPRDTDVEGRRCCLLVSMD
jgi:hypothetical protein